MDIIRELSKRKKFIPQIIKRYEDLKNPLPDIIIKNAGRIAFFPVQIASASSMDLQFYGVARKMNLLPVWDEYSEDIFSGINGRKVAYLKPRNKYGIATKIAEPKDWEGKKLSEIKLLNGETLLDFHHKKWEQEFASLGGICMDLSSWLNNFGKAEEYYYHAMILYTFFGAKFWPANINSLYKEGEKESLIERVMNPAREQIKAEFGFYPLEHYFELVPTLSF